MKKAVAIIICILLAINLCMMFGIKDNLNTINSNINSLQNQIAGLNTTVNGITYNIENKIDEQASIISSCSWDYTDMDYSDKIIKASISIVPKEYSANTQISFMHGEKEYPMTEKNGAFITEIELGIGEKIEIGKFVFKTDTVTKIQEQELYIDPMFDILPHTDAMHLGSYDEKGNFKGEFQADIRMNEKASIGSADLVFTLNGKEIDRIPMNTNNNRQGSSSKAVVGISTSINVMNYYYTASVDKKYDVKTGDTIEISVEVKDNLNWTYSTIVLGIRYDAEDETSEMTHTLLNKVYDEKGILIYSEDVSDLWF